MKTRRKKIGSATRKPLVVMVSHHATLFAFFAAWRERFNTKVKSSDWEKYLISSFSFSPLLSPSQWLIKDSGEKLIHFRSIVFPIQFMIETRRTDASRKRERKRKALAL
jgi:hypothetical protein